MHPVGDFWVDHHTDAAEDNPGQCRACHGADYRGTVLSRALGDRVVDTEWGTKNFWRGFQIGCYTCHNGPYEDDRSRNRAPVVGDVAASTSVGTPVQVPLSANDADGDSLTLRVVSQPSNGTVGLVGTVATFYPFAGFAGSDSFTYAAWDGSTDSNLATGRLTVSGGGGSCTVTCSATVPSTIEVGSAVSFAGQATASDCAGSPAFSWDFGDGTGGSGATASHAYAAPGSYDWTLTVTTDGETCTRTGTIEVTPVATTCSLRCDAEVKRRGVVDRTVEFHGSAESDGCSGSPTFEWSFGDGSSAAFGKEVAHRYSTPSIYTWRLRVLQDGATCATEGAISIQGASRRVSSK
jgi:PKD repeat protein